MMKRAFTLIELLIVITIIGILSTIVAVNYPNYIKKANDARRKSDLKQYQVALEIFANKNASLYPSYTSPAYLSSTVCPLLGVSSCPNDPGAPSKFYKYYTDATATNYVIWAKLDYAPTYTFWAFCSNGKSGVTNSVLPSLDCSDVTQQ